jgi:hypothetical protein
MLDDLADPEIDGNVFFPETGFLGDFSPRSGPSQGSYRNPDFAGTLPEM